MSLPYMPFYVNDWLSSTRFMSPTDRDAYFTALCLSWANDGLPPDAELPDRVRSKFCESEDGKLRNTKQEKVRADACRLHSQKVEAGRRGAAARLAALKQRSSSVEAPLEQRSSSVEAAPHTLLKQRSSNQNQNQMSSKEDDNTPLPPQGGSAVADEVKTRPVKSVAYSEDFDAFWSIYPRKEGKGAAWEAWQKRKKPVPDIDAILPALRRAMSSSQWVKDGGQFIPMPTTWINQRRWEDGGIEPSGDSASTASSYL